jgi:hypothetical protein
MTSKHVRREHLSPYQTIYLLHLSKHMLCVLHLDVEDRSENKRKSKFELVIS